MSVVPLKTSPRHETAVRYAHDDYQHPTADDVRRLIKRHALSGSAVGKMLGVDARTVRKRCGGERQISYSAWRLLLIETGEV